MHWWVCTRCSLEIPESETEIHDLPPTFGPEPGRYHVRHEQRLNRYAPHSAVDDVEVLCGPVVLDDGEGDADD